jgi:hypothetical protein
MGGSSRRQTVGYRYRMALHFAACYGPVDRFLRLIVGDRVAWSGSVESNEAIEVNAPQLFGGDEREGGIVGTLRVLMGGPAQTLGSPITSRLPSPAPAFRGVLSFFYNGQISANNPYVKPFAFQLTRILEGWDGGSAWYPEKAPIPIFSTPPPPEQTLSPVTAATAEGAGTGGINLTNLSSTLNLSAPAAGIGSAYCVAFRLEPNSPGFIGTSATLYIRVGGYEVWSQTIVFDGALDYVVRRQINYVGHGDVEIEFGVTSGPAWNGSFTRLIAAIPGATAYESVSALTVVTPEDDDFGVVRDGVGNLRYADWDGTSIGNNLWGEPTYGEDPPVDAYAMNPAHIVYQCLTDPQWGMGYPLLSIDTTSFADAADTLFDEGLGLCLLWNQQEELGAFIRGVLDHCGAILYTDPATGKFALKLIRGDYTPSALPIYNELSIVALESFQRVGYGDTINEITVVYRDISTNKDTPITVHNLANIQAQGGVVSQTRQYPGLPVASLAARVAQRDLIASSTPLAKARMTVNRRGWALFPGDVFKLSWAKLGLDEVIVRVLAIDYGSLTDGTLTVEVAEDVFGLPASSYVAQEPAGWEEPDTSAALITAQDLVEAPYYSLVAEVGQADADALDVDAAFFSAVASRPTPLSLSFNLWARVGAADFEQEAAGAFVPSATLAVAIDQQATALTLADGVDIDQVEPGTLAIVGTGRVAEWVLVNDIDEEAGTITVSRGMLDTTPGEHAGGSPVFFDDARSAADQTERATGEAIEAKLATVATGGTLDYNLAASISATADQRQARPYPPGNALINGEAFPTLIEETLSIEWSHRDRQQQTAGLIEQTAGDIGPEAGTTYNVRIYDDDTDALLTQALGIDGTSIAMAVGSGNIRVEIHSERDGLESWQAQVRSFVYAADAIATEAGDYLITEEGLFISDEDGGGATLELVLQDSDHTGLQLVGSAIFTTNTSDRRVRTYDPTTGIRQSGQVGSLTASGTAGDWSAATATDYYVAVHEAGGDSIARLAASAPTAIAATTGAAVLDDLRGIMHDGTDLWACDVGAGAVMRFDPSALTLSNSYSIAGGVFGLDYDGADLWAACFTSDEVVKITPATGAEADRFSVVAAPRWVIATGPVVFVSSNTEVASYDAGTGALIESRAAAGLVRWGEVIAAKKAGGAVLIFNATTGALIDEIILPVSGAFVGAADDVIFATGGGSVAYGFRR